MSAEPEPPTATSVADAPNPVPSAQPPADAEPAAPSATTSDANKAIAVAEVVASSDPPAPNEEAANDPADGEGTGEPTAAGVESGAIAVAPDADLAAEGEATSAKKNQRRKSSGGIPEHKSKKLNRKKSMPTLNLDAKPGDYFWARLKGYPPWPAIICDEEMLPESLLANRPVTAKRPDGTYRADYDEGGKNVRDRTYPIMYLHTNEFSWIPNSDIQTLDLEEIQTAEPTKKTKQLWGAYEVAREKHDLQYFKDLLLEHERSIQQEIAEEEAREQEKLAKKQQKEKRKSKTKTDDGDVEMVDAEDGEAKKSAKGSKKRKNDGEADTEKPTKTPKTKLKVSLGKTPNGESAKKSKAKQSEAAKPAEPEQTEEEKAEKRKKEVLYFRHRLQKGFLADTSPNDEVLQQMSECIRNLEQTHKDLDTATIRATKIHKVFKALLKLDSIPKDDEYKFRDRSVALLNVWSKALAEDATTPNERSAKDEGTPNGVRDEKEDTKEQAEKETSVKGSEKTTVEDSEAKDGPDSNPAAPAGTDEAKDQASSKVKSATEGDVPTAAVTSEDTAATGTTESAVVAT